jgi:hypothetical protein
MQHDGSGPMPWLLAVQPDSSQAGVLRDALAAHISDDVVIAESLDDALAAIEKEIPDVLLLPTLMPAAVEDYLITYLGAIPSARRIQILGLPRLEKSESSVPQRARSLLAWPWRQNPRPVGTISCDPGIFTRDVIAYLAGARAMKEGSLTGEIELFSTDALATRAERRTERRFASNEVPWISVVRFGQQRAALINVSLGGALLRTDARPEYRVLRRFDPTVRERPRLILEVDSDGEVHAAGRVIRCVPSASGARTQYEVAFSFDNSVGLHLPAGALLPVSDRVTKRAG